MELEVKPEPPKDVREAIRAALRRLEAERESAWWRAGVEESVRDEPR